MHGSMNITKINVNIFCLFVSTSLTVCFSFRFLYFVLFGDFNFAPYSMDETSYNIARLW
jgi:hypothetical protein